MKKQTEGLLQYLFSQEQYTEMLTVFCEGNMPSYFEVFEWM